MVTARDYDHAFWWYMGYIGDILGIYWMGEKKMETTVGGLGFRVLQYSFLPRLESLGFRGST